MSIEMTAATCTRRRSTPAPTTRWSRCCATTTAPTPTSCGRSSGRAPSTVATRQLYDELVGAFEETDIATLAEHRLRLRVDGRRHAHRAAAVAAEHRRGPADRLDPRSSRPATAPCSPTPPGSATTSTPCSSTTPSRWRPAVGGRLSDDEPRRLDRRRLLQSGGLTVALGALVAACGGDDSAEEGAPGRVGYAPPATPLPTVETNDIVYLRTATSIEQTLVETYQRIAGAGALLGADAARARAAHRGPPGGRHGDGGADDRRPAASPMSAPTRGTSSAS